MRMSLFFTKGFLTLILALFALPGAAQSTRPGQKEDRSAVAADAGRERISRAVAEGDTAAAEKLFTELTGKTPAQVGPGWDFSTTYEELKACGFYPQETRLECILDIKRPGGYGGPPVGRASHEFVTFCVDWNCDGSYSTDEAVGYGMVHMHDEASAAPPAWQYAVYRDIDPPGSLSQKCFMRTGPGGNPVLTTTRTMTVNARAILSWFAPVTSCNSVPYWGNTVNFRIRLDPIR